MLFFLIQYMLNCFFFFFPTRIISQLVKNMTSTSWGWDAFRKINDSFTVNNASYYGADFYTPDDHGTAHISILAPNGDAVAVTSTVNQ